MADGKTLNKVARAWTNADKEAFARGMAQGPAVPVDPSQAAAAQEQAAEAKFAQMRQGMPQESDIAAMQAANLQNPSVQERLNKIAAARAKFYGEAK